MHIICLTPLEPGIYNDHASDSISTPPEGWAYIPPDFSLPSTFPRLGSIKTENVTYTREVETPKEIIRERDTGMLNEDGSPIMEKYTVTENVTEERKYTMLTVTEMTEGTLPEAAEKSEKSIDPMDQLRADIDFLAVMTGVSL